MNHLLRPLNWIRDLIAKPKMTCSLAIRRDYICDVCGKKLHLDSKETRINVTSEATIRLVVEQLSVGLDAKATKKGWLLGEHADICPKCRG